MGPYIDAARKKIGAIASELQSGDPRPDVRFALVTFRDRGDEYVTRAHDFTPELSRMRGWLDDTTANGGGDTPESVLEGLKAGIVELGWSPNDGASMKLLYLVGDAAPHHYKDSPTEAWLADEALRRGIIMHTIACGSMEGDGQSFFESMARRTEGRPFRLAEVGRATRARASSPSVAPSISGAGATGTSSLGAAVSGSAKAYSSALGIAYKGAALPEVATRELTTTPLSVESGLLGAQLRVIRDRAAWSDLWAAHTSLAAGPRPPLPNVDFTVSQVLVLGGADEGLSLVKLESGDGVRWASLQLTASPGVRFVLIPADNTQVVAKGGGR